MDLAQLRETLPVCPLCMEIIEVDCVQFPCGAGRHLACFNCVSKYVCSEKTRDRDVTEIKCPVCRSETDFLFQCKTFEPLVKLYLDTSEDKQTNKASVQESLENGIGCSRSLLPRKYFTLKEGFQKIKKLAEYHVDLKIIAIDPQLREGGRITIRAISLLLENQFSSSIIRHYHGGIVGVQIDERRNTLQAWNTRNARLFDFPLLSTQSDTSENDQATYHVYCIRSDTLRSFGAYQTALNSFVRCTALNIRPVIVRYINSIGPVVLPTSQNSTDTTDYSSLVRDVIPMIEANHLDHSSGLEFYSLCRLREPQDEQSSMTRPLRLPHPSYGLHPLDTEGVINDVLIFNATFHVVSLVNGTLVLHSNTNLEGAKNRVELLVSEGICEPKSQTILKFRKVENMRRISRHELPGSSVAYSEIMKLSDNIEENHDKLMNPSGPVTAFI